MRFRGRKAQRRAISTVFATASGRSAKSATISSWRLEAVLGRQPPPRLLLVDVGAVGDADQRVVGVVHRAVGEMHVVGRDERQVEVVGEADEAGLGRLLERRCAARRSPDGAASRRRAGRGRARRGARRAPGPAGRGPRGSAAPSGPSAPPVRQIRPVGVGGERRERDVRQRGAAVEVVERGELHQVAEAGLVLGEQHDRPRRRRPVARMRGRRRRRGRAGSP